MSLSVGYAQPPADSLSLFPRGPLQGPPGGPHGPGKGGPPRFVDIDGDGINDLAPDMDRDGLPDAMDPFFLGPQALWRMKWYLLMPEKAKQDSALFTEWWESLNTRVPADRAWQRWQNAWFFSLPDSAKTSQEAFRNWWVETKKTQEWDVGWWAWRRWLEFGGPEMMDRGRMFDPMNRPWDDTPGSGEGRGRRGRRP